MKRDVRIKRVYEPAQRDDGFRVLVDRVWPRGVSKDEAHIDLWAKDIAPSPELRKWFGHDPERWTEFRKRYEAQLNDADAEAQIQMIMNAAKHFDAITLVYGAKDEKHNQAVVLQRVFQRAMSPSVLRRRR